jgi:hypothetical protein
MLIVLQDASAGDALHGLRVLAQPLEIDAEGRNTFLFFDTDHLDLVQWLLLHELRSD